MFKTIFALLLLAISSTGFATTLTPKDKTNPIKVIGHWKQYNIYDVEPDDLNLDIGPFHFSGQQFDSDLDVANAMTPVDVADINQHGVRCVFLCVNPMNQVIGFDPKVYAVSYKNAHRAH